ncbi:MAG: hypothetical protein R2854_22185 [Caldilineaceae bacterium]
MRLIALSIAAGVSGQAAIKLGIGGGAPAGAGNGPVQLVMTILHSPLILLGLGLYALGVGVDRRVGQADLSYAYPFLALNFVLITLGPSLGWAKWCRSCAGRRGDHLRRHLSHRPQRI